METITFDQLIGNDEAVARLRVASIAAKQDCRCVPHVLFVGQRGLGKTTLAKATATEVGGHFEECPSGGKELKDADSVFNFFSKLGPFGVAFVDEIHTIPDPGQQVMLRLLEDQRIQTRDGVTHTLPPFTLIGATTDADMLSGPFQARFPYKVYLDRMGDELKEVILRHLDYATVDDDALDLLVEISAGTPRDAFQITSYLLRDYCVVAGVKHVDLATVQVMMALNGINPLGLTDADVRVIRVLDSSGGLLSENNLRAKVGGETLGESLAKLKYIGLIEPTPRGQKLTQKGKEYLWRV